MGALLVVLFGVVLYAVVDRHSRLARNDWDRTLDIAFVLVDVEGVDPAGIEALRARLPELEERLATEGHRYRPSMPRPFRLRLLGPVRGAAPPAAPEGDSIVDLAKYALAQRDYVKDIDARAGVDGGYDSRVYLALRKPRHALQTLVEGHSEEGGRIGIVELELDTEAEAAHLPLVVAAHEMLHTLGATDKYDSNGRTLIPQGLAEPERVPLLPQRFAEIMARNRPISPSEEKVPASIAEIAVGAQTAREIRWF